MPTCSFCKKPYNEHKGIVVFTFDGKSLSYCSGKCRRNAELGRDPKKTNWVRREKKGKSIKELKEEKIRSIKEDTGDKK
ncbi:50S ribosomal protein L24e [Candidatus Pacearchaeota archaeon]|nr:50S ribosomal protein L24e [Candidatus Pacearchaeota archaeon]MBD3283213.1 50S ribosomal protein L24e [Candidatus Pacearchaeota archaeon]